MAETLFLTDGRIEIIFSDRDFLELVDRCMGSDARGWLEERLAEKESNADYVSDLEKETDRLRMHHKEVMEELQKESAIIARLIRSREIDRRALSATAGNIGRITWREVSR